MVKEDRQKRLGEAPAKVSRQRVAKEVPDFPADQIAKLRATFPQAFTEGKLDIAKLRASLGESIDTGAERYFFSWSGRRNATQILQMPTRATLVPLKDQSVDFDTTQNLFIEGENLEVLKLLYKPYFGRVKMIYIDPPYNTGGDFVYPDNYADPLETYLIVSGQKSLEGNLVTSNTETAGRFHSAWLSMMYPRLFFSKALLSDDGVIFVSIDDHEIANLRLIMNEIFGEENFIGVIVWQTATDNNATQIAVEHEYVVCYAKNISNQSEWEIPSPKAKLIQTKYEELKAKFQNDLDRIEDELTQWIRIQQKAGEVDLSGVAHYCYVDQKGVYYPGNSANTRPGGYLFDIVHPVTKKACAKPANGYRWPKRTFDEAVKRGDVEWGPDHTYVPKIKKRLETASELLKSVYYEDNRRATKELTSLMGAKVFDNPKSPRLVRRLIQFACDKDAIVVDFFAGSGTTAEAVFDINQEDGGKRHFVLVQLQEPTPEDSIARKSGYATIDKIAEERIRRAIDRIKTARREAGGSATAQDLGFKVLRLGESNYKPWRGIDDKTPERYASEMEASTDVLIKGWKKENVIYEVAIKEGFGLSLKIERDEGTRENEIIQVTDQENGRSFYICLDDKIKSSTIRGLEFSQDDLFVCRDISLDDTAAANLALQCRLKTI